MTELTLHYAPRSRALTAVWMLEALQVPYTLESFELSTAKVDAFRALNPMGKVPLLVANGQPIAETGAIAVWLGDTFADKGLAPAIDDADRGAYLKWMFFSGSVIEPCLGEKFFKWDLPASSVAWGSYARMERTLEAAFNAGPYLLGDRFTLADIVVGNSARFGVMFGVIPKDGAIAAYVDRLTAREDFKRAAAIEARENERFPPPAS